MWPSRRPDPTGTGSRWRALLVALLTYAAGLGILTGCSVGDDPSTPPASVTRDDPGRRQVVAAVQRLLDRRAEAVRGGDRAAYVSTVATGRDADEAEQLTYFDNLAQLPVGEFSLRLRPDTVRGGGNTWAGAVEVTLQLEGYDAAPVVRLSRFDFTRGRGGWRVASDLDEEWQRDYGGDLQPWRTGPIEVERGPRVLGIFDGGSIAAAPALVDVVEQGIDEVAARVPVEWNTRVVVYALSDTRMLRGLPQLPGDDPSALDAVAFPVVARPEDPELAATRFLLHPRMLASEPTELARLVRHELTHVALGESDDRVPVWLAEGIAEWVSVQPLPEDQRVVSGAAVAAAQAGDVALAADDDFNGEDAAINYGLSWWAVETLVDVYGEQQLWTLLETMAQTPADEQDEVLETVIGMDADQLAREAARRIVQRYG